MNRPKFNLPAACLLVGLVALPCLIAQPTLEGPGAGVFAIPAPVSGGSSYNPSTDSNAKGVWRTDEISGTYSDGASVTVWTKLVGTNLAQATAPSAPIYKTGIQNGRGVVRFNGTSQNIHTSGNFVVGNQPYTLFLVFKLSTTVGTAAVLMSDDSGTVTTTSRATSLWGMNGGSGSMNTGAAANNNWNIIMWVWNGSSSAWRTNSGTRTTMGTSPGTAAWTGDITFGSLNNNTTYAGMDIGEIIIRSGDSSADEAAIFTYLNGRWNVY